MESYKSPEKYPIDNKITIFLGGSIEMNLAEKWQERLTNSLSEYNVRILNPRRDDFDNSQKQTINNTYFKEQVEWELNGLDRSNLIVFYLQKDTYSPISMMEIGLYITDLNKDKKMIICCPDGFWRKGNIEILVNRYSNNCLLVNSFEEFEESIKSYLM